MGAHSLREMEGGGREVGRIQGSRWGGSMLPSLSLRWVLKNSFLNAFESCCYWRLNTEYRMVMFFLPFQIMGMLVGKVAHETIIVMDTFPLMVEGTEVRVNPQVILFNLPFDQNAALKKAGVHWLHLLLITNYWNIRFCRNKPTSL